MNREEKNTAIEELSNKFNSYDCFYITDFSGLNVDQINKLRKACYEKEIEFTVIKNTLVKKALEKSNNKYEQLYEVLNGPTSLFFAKIASSPAKILKDFRKNYKKPTIKAAWIDTEILLGDEHLDALASLKSKEELIGDIIGLLKFPIQKVISALQSSGDKIVRIIESMSNNTEPIEDKPKTEANIKSKENTDNESDENADDKNEELKSETKSDNKTEEQADNTDEKKEPSEDKEDKTNNP